MNCLNIRKRSITCNHNGRKLRKLGKIPGVLYGKANENFLFEVSSMDLNEEMFTHGEFGVIDINHDGIIEKALIKEVQKDPVSHDIIHIDLESINEDDMVVADVPVKFCNEGLVNSQGGIVQKEKDIVKIKCMSKDIPKSININFKNSTLGTSIRVNDIEAGESIRFLEDPDMVLASISYTKRDAVEDAGN